MKRKVFQLKNYLTLCLTVLLFIFSSQSVFASQTINIFTTNDIHGNVEATDTNIGIAQTAAIAASNNNSVLIDAGDATQGASFASVSQGQDVIKVMNAAGYDAMAAGNHEFDYGADQLLTNVGLADFPVISANVKKDGEPLLDATAVLEVAGKKIGLIGLTTTSTATSTNPSKLSGIVFEDEIQATKDQIAALDDVDTIIIVSHLGDNASAVSCTSKKLLDGLSESELSKVGAVVDGHSHTEENSDYTRGSKSIPIVQTGCYLTKIGHIELTIQDNGSTSGKVDLIDFETAKNYKINNSGTTVFNKVTKALDKIKPEQDKVLNQVICQSSTPLWGGYVYYDYAEPRIVETNYGDFVTDAFRESGKTFAAQNNINLPIIGVENGGGISATLNPGDVKRGDILNAFNHGNMVEAIQISPAELFSGIESGLATTGQNKNGTLERERVSGSFAQVSGLKYTYDPNGADGNKVTEIVLDNGTKLNRTDNQRNIMMVTNSYVASAFDKAKKLGELGGEDMIIEDYLLSQTQNGTVPLNVPVTANRIVIANDTSPETYDIAIPVVDIATVQDEQPKAVANAYVGISIDGNTPTHYQADSSGIIHLTLSKGPHSLIATESADNMPVYVNNYSGSGTITTKTGYYKLNFAVDPETVKRIPTESISLPEGSNTIILTTDGASSTYELRATVEPSNGTDDIEWSTDFPSVLEITPNGNTAVIKALDQGIANVTVSSGDKATSVRVIVSDQPVISDNLDISANSYDQFTVTARNVRTNPYITDNPIISDVTMFAWSAPDQSDISAVHAVKDSGSNDYYYTFSVNGTQPNTYFNDASHINIHIYTNQGSSSNLLATGLYDYASYDPGNTLTITPYAQNIGFITPSVNENMIAGTVGQARQLEGIRLDTQIEGLEINYSVHAQDIGWMDPVTGGQYAGTMGQNRQIEAIQISLSGEQAPNYSVRYKAHVQDIGWMDPVSDGEIAGTTGQNKQLEAVEIELVAK